jgi:hypothetical protein
MPPTTPSSVEVLNAVEIYLKLAYLADPPLLVRSQLDRLRAAGEELFKCPVLVPDRPTNPARYTLRLGNQYYPHMKLVVELSPGGDRFMFRADTHDRHVCPGSSSPDYPHFCELMTKNQKLAESIERTWEGAGIPTFRAYLRNDLSRRMAGGL